MELEVNSVGHLLGERLLIAFLCSLVCNLAQIVTLQLYAVELVISAKALYLFLGLLLRQHYIAFLVACELVEEVLVCEFLSVALLGTEILWDGEVRHDGGTVDGVELYLVADLHRVCHGLGDVAEHLPHLGLCLHPLLLGVEHTVGVVKVLACAKADESVMRLGILLVYKVHVVRAYELHATLLAQFDDVLVHLNLQRVYLVVGAFYGCLVQLQLKVVVVAEKVLVPVHDLLGLFHLAVPYELRNLATKTCRAADDALVVFLKLHLVGTRIVVVTLAPCLGYYLYKVVVALLVLGKQQKVVSAVILGLLVEQTALCNVHLATDDWLELLLGFLALVHATHVVVEFLYTHHVSMVGYGNALHPVGNCLVDESLYGCLAIEDGVL